MGGYGSTRWDWHTKKILVEDCIKLPISFLKPYLPYGNWNTVRWSRGGQERGSISYRVSGGDRPTSLRLNYTIGARSGHPEDFAYEVILTTTPLPWGGVRYWFVCPFHGCGQRVGCLYLPPGGKYFGCRHCYKLTYESQSEYHSSKNMFRSMAASMQGIYPGINWKDMRAWFEDKETPHFAKLQYEQYLREWQEYDPYERYLSVDELCRQSGLTPDDLSRLEAARLLLPDTKDGRYRPKLAGWGKKLAYLLREGWGIEEIKEWAKGRWKKENPRQWPPIRYDYG